MTVTYKQPVGRPWDADRMFRFIIPKNPIHFIENGFEPKSAITGDWETLGFATTVTVTAKTVFDGVETPILWPGRSVNG